MRFLIIIFFLSFSLSAGANSDFKAQKSMLDASERVLNQEKDPFKRLQLLLRWVRIKEEYDKNQIFESELSQSEELQNSKREIISKLEVELENLFKTEKLDLEPIFRELAFRYLEMREFEKASSSFRRVRQKTPNDFLAFGDVLVQLNQNSEALQAYDLASQDPKIFSAAAYKKAWVYMRENNFESALREFDACISDTELTHLTLKEEAYKDRIRPFIETFRIESFDETHIEDLRSLAKKATSTSPAQKKLFDEALKSLIQGFTAKSEIEIAQQVFNFLKAELKDTLETLIFAAPTWIKVYRSRLEHEQVERILNSLPTHEIEIKSSNNLRAELHNSALFYETLLEDTAQKDKRPILILGYKRYFQLYPLDLEANSLRINYARLLLQDLEAKECIDILDKRKRPENSIDLDPIENLAKSLDGKCRLKYLDQLYAKDHTPEFYLELQKALLEKKIHDYPNLGMPAENAFQVMTRMLIGAIQKNPSHTELRAHLKNVISQFPYSNLGELRIELQIISAELAFQDLSASKESDETKASHFFEIYRDSPPNSDVALKALNNSILLTPSEAGLDRCETFQEKYESEFKKETAVFDHCIKLAEDYLWVEREYRFWNAQTNLNEAQSIRLGLLELALEKPSGRQRIEKLKTESGKRVLENWDGSWPQPELSDSKWNSLDKKVQRFVAGLKPISFEKIESEVAKNISAVDRLDAELVAYAEKQKNPFFQANTLYARALLNSDFGEWLKKLPEPKKMSEEELLAYRERASEFVEPWLKRAEAYRKECSNLAHSLSPEFRATRLDICQEETTEEIYQEFLSAWRSSLNQSGRIQRNILEIMQKASQTATATPLRARYYLFRALELSQNDMERARIFLALAKLTNQERFWRQAASLDGSLTDPIQWHQEKTKGNPFFENLYDRKIRILRRMRDQNRN